MPKSRWRTSYAARVPREATFHEAGRTLVLVDRGAHHELTIGGIPILTSALLGTERAFGRLAGRLADRARARVVIGGLGFGATLRGVLDVAPADARVVVVEKVAALPRLLRGELARFGPDLLDDPRVSVVCADVVDVIAAARADTDAILLDVDNGPGWASFRTNARLYAPAGLARARQALAPGGSLAVWSGYPADAFRVALRAAGLAPSVVPLREPGRLRRGPSACAYVGLRRGPDDATS